MVSAGIQKDETETNYVENGVVKDIDYGKFVKKIYLFFFNFESVFIINHYY